MLSACQNADNLTAPEANKATKTIVAKDIPSSNIETLATKQDPITKTSLDGADVQSDDLDTLRAELEALNKDLATIRQDLVQTNATTVVPDISISTPRSMPTDKIVAIPDSLEEEAMLDIATVNGVRVGSHPDKIRLVFDIANHNAAKPEIKLSGKLLQFQLLKTKWPESSQQFSSLESQVGIFKTDQERDDLSVTILLNKDMRLKSTDLLPPNETGAPRRLVIDLAPL